MAFPSLFSFCPYCAASLDAVRCEGQERRRCPNCEWIQYRNPTVGAAVVLTRNHLLLLGKRRGGKWCIPCGHVEWNESVEEAAVREFVEETGLEVQLDGVLAVKSNFHNPERQTVGVWFRGRHVGGSLQAGGDLIDVAWTPRDKMPELAFPTDHEVIRQLFDASSPDTSNNADRS